MLRRKRNSLTSANCTLRDEKEPIVFWAKRWSALEGEQLDERQLYVEGRERGYWYGTFAGRRDGRSMLRRKRNSFTSGNCTLRDGRDATSMVRLLCEEMVCLCCVGRGTA
jgi:hypothetical protein